MQIKQNWEKFGSLDEFIDFLSRGGELEFKFKNKKYSITHGEDVLYFIEQYNLDSGQIFYSVNKLLEYKIENYKIKDIITIIEPFFRTF